MHDRAWTQHNIPEAWATTFSPHTCAKGSRRSMFRHDVLTLLGLHWHYSVTQCPFATIKTKTGQDETSLTEQSCPYICSCHPSRHSRLLLLLLVVLSLSNTSRQINERGKNTATERWMKMWRGRGWEDKGRENCVGEGQMVVKRTKKKRGRWKGKKRGSKGVRTLGKDAQVSK